MSFKKYNRPLDRWDPTSVQGIAKAYQFDADADPARWLDAYRDHGLVGYWSLDDMHTADDLALDASGSYEDGPIGDGITTGISAPVGQGYDFAQVDDGIGDLYTEAEMDDGATYSVWCYLDDYDFPESGVLRGYSNGPHHWELRSDELRLRIADYDHRMDAYVPVREWFHWAVAYDDDEGEGQHYLNGEPIGEPRSEDANSMVTVDIIGHSQSSSRYFDGRLAEVRVYNRRLEDDEIEGLYDLGEGVISDSLAHWTLDDERTDDDDAIDSAIRGLENHGEISSDGVIPGIESPVGEGYRFDEEEGDVRVSGGDFRASVDEPFSVSAWIDPDRPSGDTNVATSIATVGSYDGAYGLDVHHSREYIRGGVRDTNDDRAEATFDYSFSGDGWVLATFVNDPDSEELRIYRDGELADTASTEEIGDITSTDDLHIGSNRPVSSSAHHYAGGISDVKYHDRALTDLEVEELYAKKRDDFINAQISQWSLDAETTEYAEDTSTVPDRTGRFTGTIHGGVTLGVESPVGRGFGFDGVDDYIEFQNSERALIGNGTVSFWTEVAPESVQDDRPYFISNHRDMEVELNPGFGIRYNRAGGYRVELNSASGDSLRAETNTDDLFSRVGEWIHITVRLEGDELALFIDGELDRTQDTDIQFEESAHPLCLAVMARSAPSHFLLEGKLSDVRLYNQALDDSEIERLYEMGETVDLGRVGHWTLDDEHTDGDITQDISPNENHGTLIGGVTTGVSSPVGEGFEFDGVDDWVDTNYAFPMQDFDAYSFSVWYQVDWEEDDEQLAVFSQNHWRNAIRIEEDRTRFYARGEGDTGHSVDVQATNDGTWHHAVMTAVAGDKYEVYINGDKAGDEDAPGAFYDMGDNVVEIAARRSHLQNRFRGKISDFRLYGRALTESEIEGLYEMGDT
jgi:hypothetical protein